MTKRGRPLGTINRKTGYKLLKEGKPFYAICVTFDRGTWGGPWYFHYVAEKIVTRREARFRKDSTWFANYWLAHAYVLRQNKRENVI